MDPTSNSPQRSRLLDLISSLISLFRTIGISIFYSFLRLSFPFASTSLTPSSQDPRKVQFLAQYGKQYGFPHGPISIDELRAEEFARLDGTIYLDHAGATLYANSQIRACMEHFSEALYGNPHSQNGSSTYSSNAIAYARDEVLKFFNAPAGEYSCVFTSGATGALKLVGENFPWSCQSNYLYAMENHNSVLGIREYALAAGATTCAVDIDQFACDKKDNSPAWFENFKLRALQRRASQASKVEKTDGPVYNLFCFPSECNFSGEKFDLHLVQRIQDGKHLKNSVGLWMVLIDAAKGCGTSQLDLSKYPADFVAVSFYKIFGYPTGLGALLARNDSAERLQKKYFAGGTVAVSIADVDFVKKREKVEQWLEDGTISFLGISALRHGFAAVNKIGLSNIGMHVGSLAKFTASSLLALRHKNGNTVCVLYGRHRWAADHAMSYWGDNCKQGPVVTFNLKHSDGSWIGYREVENLAALSGIHLRTGCFCNPGACSKQVGLSESELRANHEAGHVCWDTHDIMDGKPTGAVRVSFGYMSTIEDSLTLIDFIRMFFVDNYIQPSNLSPKQQHMDFLQGLPSRGSPTHRNKLYLESITIYPIKSCAGFSTKSWPLSDCGLLYDREWIIVSATGDVLTQKKYPVLCLIGTYIDLSTNKLFVTSPNMKKQLEVSIPTIPRQYEVDVGFELCGKRSEGQVSAKEVAEWLTEALGTSCTLVRKGPRSRHVSSRGFHDSQGCREARELSFANEGQFLLISRASVEDLNHRINSSLQAAQKRAHHASKMQIDVLRFRPNFVISGGFPYEEDGWQSLVIGGEVFSVLGGCNRCQMINIDQKTGSFPDGSHPLLTLASYRRFKGKILFGVLLVHNPSQTKSECMEGTDTSAQFQRLMRVGCLVYAENNLCP